MYRRKDILTEELARLYFEEECSIPVIEKRLNCTKQLIQNRFRKAGLKFRSVKEAMDLAIKHGRRIQSGEGSPNWGNGRCITADGYIFLRRPNHPKAQRDGYVREHLIVWEEFNKMPLPKGYIIHHVNGIKADNRIKNLLAIPLGQHSPGLTVKEVQKRLREVEAELSQQRLKI